MKQTDAYIRALDAAKRASGKDRGAAVWLANLLKVDRQTLFYWSHTGFPPGKAAAVAELIGTDPDEIKTTTLEMPISTWKATKVPKRLAHTITVLK